MAGLSPCEGQPGPSQLCPSLPDGGAARGEARRARSRAQPPHRLPRFPWGWTRIQNKAATAGPGLGAALLGPSRDHPGIRPAGGAARAGPTAPPGGGSWSCGRGRTESSAGMGDGRWEMRPWEKNLARDITA